MTLCGVITGAEDDRTRCVEDVDHRGPHWRNVEAVGCDCELFCPGHTP